MSCLSDKPVVKLKFVHRAAVLETEIKNKERFAIPRVTIWECYGNLVHTIFPFEFSHVLTGEFINNAM